MERNIALTRGDIPLCFLHLKMLNSIRGKQHLIKIRGLLQEEYGRHQELLGSDEIAKYEKEYFMRIIEGTANEVDLTSALEKISKMLKSHYGKAPIIIIDEYDTPIQEGYSKEFYDEI